MLDALDLLVELSAHRADTVGLDAEPQQLSLDLLGCKPSRKCHEHVEIVPFDVRPLSHLLVSPRIEQRVVAGRRAVVSHGHACTTGSPDTRLQMIICTRPAWS